jgi:hypothetical protein
MQLSDFATLAEAQAYELITDKKQIGSGQARGFFVNNGIWTTLRQIQGDITHQLFALADAVIVTASDASSFFGLDTTTAEGLGNLAAADIMVGAGIMTEAQKDEMLALALKSTYPHVDATQAEFDEAKDTGGEPINLKQSNSQHVITVSITKQPLKPTGLKIQQRFGADINDMTEWHDCGEVRNVYYTQRTYQTMVPASPTAYRELRLVSPLTLGVSIA